MSILSVTFHSPLDQLEAWQEYSKNVLPEMIGNLMDVERYMLSDVESEMINEGHNTSLLLIFDSPEKRKDFVEIELLNISELIEQKFGDSIMIFTTYLNPQINKL
jgi:hypothetical protein